MFRAWAWAKWECKGCGSILGFNMKRRFLMAAIFAPIGAIMGFVSTTGFRFGSTWVWLAFLAALSIIGTLVALKLEGIRVCEPRGLFCEGCGYNLTGNTSAACPECGRATPIAQAINISDIPVAHPVTDQHQA